MARTPGSYACAEEHDLPIPFVLVGGTLCFRWEFRSWNGNLFFSLRFLFQTFHNTTSTPPLAKIALMTASSAGFGDSIVK